MSLYDIIPPITLLTVCIGALTDMFTEPWSLTRNETISTVSNETEICMEDGCIDAASIVLDNMDKDAHPCEDFFQFACGQFVRSRYLHDHISVLNRSSIIKDKLRTQLYSILNKLPSPEDSKPLRDAKLAFKTCMNNADEQPVLEMLKELGGWPVLEEHWDGNDWTWTETVYKLRESGLSVDHLIEFSIINDPGYPSAMIPKLDQPPLGIEREYLVQGMNNSYVRNYYDYMVDVAVLLQGDRTRAKHELLESLQLEISLAKVSLPKEQRMDYKKIRNMTVASVKDVYPTIPWVEYVSRLAYYDISDDFHLLVAAPKYITALETILASTPKRTLANYLMWRTASTTVRYLQDRFLERSDQFIREITGVEMGPNRWDKCCDFVAENMAEAVASFYIGHFFNEKARNWTASLVDMVKRELVDDLDNLDWMDDDTKVAVSNRTDAMVAHVGYLEELLNETKVVKFYEEVFDKETAGSSLAAKTTTLEIDPNGTYWETQLSLLKFKQVKSRNLLNSSSSREAWTRFGHLTLEVGSFYNAEANFLYLPVTILQDVFLSVGRPAFMNFGALGFLIGREIMHGFDQKGRLFRQNRSHMDNSFTTTKCNYLKRGKCVVEQFGNYTDKLTGMRINGVATQGENIADIAGLKFAYKAYRSWANRNGQEPRLPGLEQFTPLQIFWLSTANSLCSVYRPEMKRHELTTGSQSPAEIRVLGAMSNLKEFAEDFSCPFGTKMNPEKRCTVW